MVGLSGRGDKDVHVAGRRRRQDGAVAGSRGGRHWTRRSRGCARGERALVAYFTAGDPSLEPRPRAW